MGELILGGLKYALVGTIDTLNPGTSETVKQTLIDGDRYAYALDSLIISAGTITNESKLVIDFSYERGVMEQEKVLTSFPYSLRGIRVIPNAITLVKAGDYHVVEANKNVLLKISNNDVANAVEDIAYAILAYPVLGRL